MLSNPTFWVGVAFAAFVVILVYAGVHRMLTKSLDEKARKIAGDLDEARRLREEAAKVLADYERRKKEAEGEAEAIVAQAKADAERMAAEAEAKLSDFIARRTRAAEQKIAQAEVDAARDVRAAAAEAAVAAAEVILRERASGTAGAELLRKSLGDVKAQLN